RMLGQDDGFGVHQVEDEAVHRLGVSLPGDFLCTILAVRSRIFVARYRPGPVGQATRDDGAVGRFHQSRLQAAGTGVEQEDSYVACHLGHSTGQGVAFQMPAAYSAIVRSLENFPEQATLMIALRPQASASAYSSPSRCCAWAYDVRSARCM